MRRPLLLIVVVMLGALSTPNVASAHAPKYVRGRCGMRKLHIIIPYTHRWKVRIHSCAGDIHRVFGSAQPTGTATPVASFNFGSWYPFDMGPKHWGAVVDITTTAGITLGACGAFGATLAGEVPSGGATTFIAIGAAAGCVGGAIHLVGQTRDYFRTNR